MFTLSTLNPFVDRFNEGGPFLMSLILIALLLSIFFMFRTGMNLKNENGKFQKYLSLCGEVGLLALVLGIFGSVIGMIEAFDSIEAIGDEVSTALMAGGLKVSFLTMVFGTFTFIISRIAIIIFKWVRKGHFYIAAEE